MLGLGLEITKRRILGGDGVQLLLDVVQNASFAWALVLLKLGFITVVRIRRDNDDAETDVDLDGNTITLSSSVSAGGTLGTWVGANSAFVTDFYDHSGNSLTASNATIGTQPRIINAGVIDLRNLLPTVNFNISAPRELLSVTASLTQPFTIFSVSWSAGGNQVILFDSDVPRVLLNRSNNIGLTSLHAGASISGTDITGNGQVLLTGLFDGASSEAWVDGVSDATGNVGSNDIDDPIKIGRGFGSGTPTMDGDIQLLVGYDADKSADRVTAETIINNIYSIF